MKALDRISINIPGNQEQSKYFSLHIKKNIYNERSCFVGPTKLLVVSDIEGNFQSFRKLLLKNKVIDRKYEWTFDDGHLVIVGDCFDRGEQVTECLWLIYSLEERASREGGYVHFILGNHEIMNMNGDWRYVHPRYAEKKPSSRYPATALYDGNNQLWRWLRTKNIMEKVGDILFVHGGISPELLKLGYSINDINSLARLYYNHANAVHEEQLLKIIYNSELSPFWYRGYYRQEIKEEHIDATLYHFGVNTIITGHTMLNEVTSFYNGKVINVDTDHASGNSEALLITKDRFYRVPNDGKRTKIK